MYDLDISQEPRPEARTKGATTTSKVAMENWGHTHSHRHVHSTSNSPLRTINAQQQLDRSTTCVYCQIRPMNHNKEVMNNFKGFHGKPGTHPQSPHTVYIQQQLARYMTFAYQGNHAQKPQQRVLHNFQGCHGKLGTHPQHQTHPQPPTISPCTINMQQQLRLTLVNC